MKYLINLTTALILFVIFLFPALMALLIDMVPADDQPGYNDMVRVSVYDIRTFSQEFISNDSNLVAIGTSIRNPNLKNKKDIFFNLYNNNGNLIRSTSLNGINIADGVFVKFVFDKIPDSKNKKYTFTISSPSAGQVELIELFLTENTDSILNYTYDDEVHPGGVPMVTFHKPNSKWDVAKAVYSNWLSKVF